jgi:hypothetical protein
MQKMRYIDVAYRHGKPLAAYLYLPRNPDERSARTEILGDGFQIDYAADGRAIGIEIASPRLATLEAVNRALARAQQEPATCQELAPLFSAEAGSSKAN